MRNTQVHTRWRSVMTQRHSARYLTTKWNDVHSLRWWSLFRCPLHRSSPGIFKELPEVHIRFSTTYAIHDLHCNIVCQELCVSAYMVILWWWQWQKNNNDDDDDDDKKTTTMMMMARKQQQWWWWWQETNNNNDDDKETITNDTIQKREFGFRDKSTDGYSLGPHSYLYIQTFFFFLMCSVNSTMVHVFTSKSFQCLFSHGDFIYLDLESG